MDGHDVFAWVSWVLNDALWLGMSDTPRFKRPKGGKDGRRFTERAGRIQFLPYRGRDAGKNDDGGVRRLVING